MISINTTRTIITIESTLLDSFIATPASYTNVVITGSISGGSDVVETYSSTNLITAVTNVATNAGIETINPAFFTATEFVQGVYQFDIKLTSATTIEQETFCLFVENGLACSVNDYRNLEKTLQEKLLVTSDYLLLKESTECACKCEQLVEIYNNLITTLSNQKCSTC